MYALSFFLPKLNHRNSKSILTKLVLLLFMIIGSFNTTVFAESILLVSYDTDRKKNIISEFDSATDQLAEKVAFEFPSGSWASSQSFQTDDALWLKDAHTGFMVYDIKTSAIEQVGSSLSANISYTGFALPRVSQLVSSSDSGSLKIETETGDSLIEKVASDGTTSIGTNSDSSTATIITKGTATSTEISDGGGKTIIERASDGTTSIGTNSDSSAATIITKGTATSTEISDGGGKTIIERASDGTTSIGTNSDNGAATIITKGTATSTEISDGNGKTIIKRAADGSLHIGENSLVTKEENGKQSLSAQDANGDAIDINITNGSNLLINGKPITAGVSIKEVRKYDSRSVALSAALTSLPTQSIDGSHACGIGSGVRGNYSAMALGCAADLDKIKLFDNAPLFIRNASINLGTSFLTHDDPDYTFKAGLTWNFGKSKANTRSLSKNDRRDIRSTIAEQKNALAINKLQKDNRVLKESNMELTRKLNSLIAANQRFVSLASKMELLAQQIESSELVLASK